MKIYLPPPRIMAFACACLLVSSAPAITVEEDTYIYAVGSLDGNKGVYKLPVQGPFPDSPEKISTSAIGGVQWSFRDSGGTFISKDKAVGSSYVYGSIYVAIATSEGGESGPWSHTKYTYSPMYTTAMRATDMTYDPVDNKVYTWCYVNNYNTALGIFDADSETVQLVGQGQISPKIVALTSDGAGKLYAIGDDGKLYNVDKTNGSLTQEFDLGVYSMSGNGQSAAYDPATGKIYYGAVSMYSASLYEIDLEAQTCTKVYDFPTGKRYNGFYIPGPDTKKAAPAAPENLTATYTGTATDMNVSFTAPTTTFGGVEMSGELQYTVMVDGVSADTGTIDVGAEYSETISMTEGVHTVMAYLSNTAGDGAKAQVKAFAGYDTPGPVSNLEINAEGNLVTLSWNAPEGLNGGTPDMSKLRYKVTRFPGEVEVASGIAETTLTDEIPEGLLREYSYTVTVVYDDVEGESVSSDSLMIGSPYEVPYSQNFEDAESLSDITYKAICEGRGCNQQWQIVDLDGNKCLRLAYQYYQAVRDHIFTAPMQLYAGVPYTLKFKVKCAVAGERPELRVNLSKSQTSNTSDYIYPWITSRIDYLSNEENVGEFTELSYDFTVEESGVYSIDFFDTTNSWTENQYIYLDDIEVTGVFPVPAPVDNLYATPFEAGSRDIKINFTLPSKDVNGAELTSISKVVISRGSTVVEELEKMPGTNKPLTPGAAVEYLIENAPRGFQAYSVVVYNGAYQSSPVVRSTMSGYLNNLVLKKVSFPEEIKINETGIASVTVLNDAAEIALDYRVVLYADNVEFGQAVGQMIRPDDEITYEFAVPWSETFPEKISLSAEVEFFGDEYLDDNTSNSYVVRIEPKVDSVDSVEAQGCAVSVNGYVLRVTGSEGKRIAVYTADGLCETSVPAAPAVYTRTLSKGIYIVTVGGESYKVVVPSAK